MESEKLLIPVILGTNRQQRQSHKVAQFVYQQVANRVDMESSLIDIRDFEFPVDNYGRDLGKNFSDFKNLIDKADGLILVFPEYNHGYPGVLKSVLDLLLAEYNHKAAGLVTISSGPWGGLRAAENILPVLRYLGLLVISTDICFPQVKEIFTDGGEILDQNYQARLNKYLDELAWLARSLRWGRKNLL